MAQCFGPLQSISIFGSSSGAFPLQEGHGATCLSLPELPHGPLFPGLTGNHPGGLRQDPSSGAQAPFSGRSVELLRELTE